MFEITGDHIQLLNDSDLRELVRLLCEAELRRAGLPVSAVTAGGDQDAADGGLDVRVALRVPINPSSNIPRSHTGFQSKAADMPPSAIAEEMCPDGTLRPAIRELGQENGAYIIVSAQGSVTDSSLKRRREAMKAAIKSLPDESLLHLDFFDRERLATWVRDHPGMVAWVRDKVGQPIQGWHPYANWAAPEQSTDPEYIYDDTARLYDGKTAIEGPLSVRQGIERLRKVLSKPGRSARLIGLSGTGKTRLVQALFDERIGTGALDPSLALYVDLSHQLEPSPQDLAQQLIWKRQRAILVIDNCPPSAHRALVPLCTGPTSLLSLISVEYDVTDDDPEGTEVFRLESASDDVIERILAVEYSHISQVNSERIAEFAGGNARVALALAHTLRRGESVANLTDPELFGRLFQQRHSHDESLLRTAEVCSLLWSFNGEEIDGPGSELALLSALSGLSVDELYRNIAELKRRGLVQSRGPWRAVLPQAIANKLAKQALDKLHRDRIMASLLVNGSERVAKSFTRRLGYFHDSEPAQMIVRAMLSPGGLVSEVARLNSLGATLLRNIAPVDPVAVLNAIEEVATGSNGNDFLSGSNNQRGTWISLLSSIAFEPSEFIRATLLLARFLMAEPTGYNGLTAKSSFQNLFHIHLSGTHANIQQRTAVVDTLLQSSDTASQECGLVALDALLETRFFVANNFEFGARPRDYGWYPQNRQEVESWFIAAIRRVQDLGASGSALRDRARVILANHFRGLWTQTRMFDELENAMAAIAAQGFWAQGWIAIRSTIRYDAQQMTEAEKDRIAELESSMRPQTILDQVRAYVLPQRWGGLDIAVGETYDENNVVLSGRERLAKITTQLGETIASDPEALNQILPEVVCGTLGYKREFGKGLASGADSISNVWQMIMDSFNGAPERERNIEVMRGFLNQAQQRNFQEAERLLEDAVSHPILGYWFPLLQTSVNIGEQGARRLEAALKVGLAPILLYGDLGLERTAGTIPLQSFVSLVYSISSQPGGYEVAVEILGNALESLRNRKDRIPAELLECGRGLLRQFSCEHSDDRLDYELGVLFDMCCADTSAVELTSFLCHNIKQAFKEYRIWHGHFSYLLAAMFRVQPQVALDEFIGDTTFDARRALVGDFELNREDLLNHVPTPILLAWARFQPDVRFPRLAAAIVPFSAQNDGSDLQWTPLAIEILNSAPDQIAVLEVFRSHLTPMSWSGSYADTLERRRSLTQALISSAHRAVASWARIQDVALARLAAEERRNERRENEGFE